MEGNILTETYEKDKLFTDESELNCVQACLCDIARRFRQPYESIFVGLWKFEITKKVSLGKEYDDSFRELNEKMMNNLVKYTDVCYKVTSVEEIRNEYKGEGHIILVEFDTYDCPWSPGYLWKHFTYYIVIIGRENEKYVAYSPYDNISNIFITNDLLCKALKVYDFFGRKDSATKLTANEIFTQIQESTRNRVIFDEMREFAQKIAEIKDIRQIVTAEKLEDNLYVMRFAYFAKCRYCISLMFKQYMPDGVIIDLFRKSSDLWGKMKYTFIRAILTSNIAIIKKGVHQLQEAIQCEENAYSRIKRQSHEFFEQDQVVE